LWTDSTSASSPHVSDQADRQGGTRTSTEAVNEPWAEAPTSAADAQGVASQSTGATSAQLWADRLAAAAESAPDVPEAASPPTAAAPQPSAAPRPDEADPRARPSAESAAAQLWPGSHPSAQPDTSPSSEPAAADTTTSDSWQGTAASRWTQEDPRPEPAATTADPHQQASVFGAGSASVPADFSPANDVEESLLTAAGDGSTDTFLSTLLLARVLLPVATDSKAGAKPGADGFVWRTETIDGNPYVVVFTSPERQAEHLRPDHETVTVKFVQLISRWPHEDWSFAVNPGTPVGAKLPGAQIVALASWAAEVGLDAGDEPVAPPAPIAEAPRPTPAPAAVDPALPTMMQKTIAPSQVDYYLERGYDRVSGFVHRAAEVAHLTTPAQLFTALGLGYANSPFKADAAEVYVLRWPAYRPSLYRIPYGGQNETAMRAMEGWVIERAPFRGNGFAPGEGSDVIAEFKVDSARLPHDAQLWLIRADGSERVVAILDADAPGWTRVGDA
jgi:hypothetical protein